jgi:hypothetical protein
VVLGDVFEAGKDIGEAMRLLRAGYVPDVHPTVW